MSVNEMLMAAAGAGGPSEYVEDVFSTWLYTGTGSTQTINNGIDLAGKGGLVWVKQRNAAFDHALFDTARGVSKYLYSNSTGAQDTLTSYGVTAFNSNGFSLGDVSNGAYGVNGSSQTYASWTFREAQKFFDVVTYTGNGANRTISHNLGSVPGMIIVKRTDTTGDWQVYHRSLANTEYLVLNTTAAKATGTTRWNSTTPTSTVFSLGTDSTVNANGGTYVAYLFAHDAGGFGDAGTDNIISCGSYIGNGSTVGPVINLGYEPQWILVKDVTATDGFGNWLMFDNMRGLPVSGNGQQLFANSNSSEGSADRFVPTATGFNVTNGYAQSNVNGNNYIYMAIRRPMKKPTSGTQVFSPVTQTGAGTVTTNFPVDATILRAKSVADGPYVIDRLRGTNYTTSVNTPYLQTSSINAEVGVPGGLGFDSNTGFPDQFTSASYSQIYWNFRRATGFFDVVCYTGTGSATTVTHNLGAVPELLIVKRRDATGNWAVYESFSGATKHLRLNQTTKSEAFTVYWNDTSPTSTQFTVGTTTDVNGSGSTYVAYLFASLAGVSKVGTYTGNGTNQTINCGFSAGARFVLIKRTDAAGDWYVFDTARGIVSGNDPFLLLNSTAAEVTTRDAVDPDNSGFIVNNDATNFPINVNAATYIYLAIA